MLKTEKLIIENEIVLLRENVNLLQGQLSEANKRIAELIKEREDLDKYWKGVRDQLVFRLSMADDSISSEEVNGPSGKG